MFKGNNKNTNTTFLCLCCKLWKYVTSFSSVFTVTFQKANFYGEDLYTCAISRQQPGVSKRWIMKSFRTIVECNKIQRTLIFQTSNQTTTICRYGHEYIFHYEFRFGKHEISFIVNIRIIFATQIQRILIQIFLHFI